MNAKLNKILIVDDDSSIRYALAEALRSWHYESVAAANLAEARRLFHEEEPNVVLKIIMIIPGVNKSLNCKPPSP